MEERMWNALYIKKKTTEEQARWKRKKRVEKLNYKEEKKNSEEFMKKVLVRYGRILNTICVSYLKMYCIQNHSF